MDVSVAQTSKCSVSETGVSSDTPLGSYCCTNNINTPYQSSLIINTEEYHKVVSKLRAFFLSKNFLEVSTQNRLSILAA